MKLYLVQYVKDQLQTVATNATASWRFDLKSVPQDAEMAVRVRVTDLFGRLRHVGGEFSLGGRKGALSHINKTIVRVPLEGESNSDGEELVFRNGGEASVTINPRKDLNLLVRAANFAWNAFRAWLELTSVLSLIVAVAVFLGAALGRSVAVFSVVAMLVVMVVSLQRVQPRVRARKRLVRRARRGAGGRRRERRPPAARIRASFGTRHVAQKRPRLRLTGRGAWWTAQMRPAIFL